MSSNRQGRQESCRLPNNSSELTKDNLEATPSATPSPLQLLLRASKAMAVPQVPFLGIYAYNKKSGPRFTGQ
jgi:hypothetical protein